jgi:hypothetical protein
VLKRRKGVPQNQPGCNGENKKFLVFQLVTSHVIDFMVSHFKE